MMTTMTVTSRLGSDLPGCAGRHCTSGSHILPALVIRLACPGPGPASGRRPTRCRVRVLRLADLICSVFRVRVTGPEAQLAGPSRRGRRRRSDKFPVSPGRTHWRRASPAPGGAHLGFIGAPLTRTMTGTAVSGPRRRGPPAAFRVIRVIESWIMVLRGASAAAADSDICGDLPRS